MSQSGRAQSHGMVAGGLTIDRDEIPDDPSGDPRGAADRALYDVFVDVRARARGPVLCINSRVMAWNAAAVRLVDRGDHAELWQWARDAIDQGDMTVRSLQLHGVTLNGRCARVVNGLDLVGAVIHLDTQARAGGGHHGGAPRSGCRSFGWESLRESELGIAQLVSDGLTNREIGARVFLSRHTVDSHLRQIFRKLGISSRVELTRLVVEHAASGSTSAA